MSFAQPGRGVQAPQPPPCHAAISAQRSCCRVASWCWATTALMPAFGLLLYHRQGMLWTVAPCSSEMHLPLSTVLAYFFPYCHVFLPFGSGYSPHRLQRVHSIAFLGLTFTQQVYRGVRLAELIWRQCLVPRSHIYISSAFPCTVNQRAPAQKHPRGYRSPLTLVCF